MSGKCGAVTRALALSLLGVALGLDPAQASVDFTSGNLYRTAGVPAWSASSGTFTVMLWVYGPLISGNNDYFNADDGGAFGVYVDVGSAADSPTEPYFITRDGEWHFNKDGTYVANPSESIDISLGWTFLAVSFVQGGATDLYAWQAGVNEGALVHVPVRPNSSSVSGTGSINTFMLGNESGFDEGCICFMGPVYVYNGTALTERQIDAQRLQVAPLVRSGLIVFSSFLDSSGLAIDQSGTANWSVHGDPAFSTLDPPVVGSSSSTSGSSSSSSGGASNSSSGGHSSTSSSSSGSGSSSGGHSSSSSSGSAGSAGGNGGSGGATASTGSGGALGATEIFAMMGLVTLRRALRRRR